MDETNTEAIHDDLGGYKEMFEEYVAGSPWIKSPELPLVFHLRKLCRQLDADGLDKASLASAYLQAFSRLDKRRPGAAPALSDGMGPQTSIFDELDD